MKEDFMPALAPQDKRWSIFAPVLEWCYDQVRTSLRPLARERFTTISVARARPNAVNSAVGGELPDLTRHYYDAKLLFQRMEKLHVDWHELARDDPLLFRELQGICTLCRSKEQCVHDLAADFDDIGWENWQDYCPNARTLNALGALQNCSLACPAI